jgi:NAD(P)-dependent dehydrogenase (short-subunit alcohol dehydrogenase family)
MLARLPERISADKEDGVLLENKNAVIYGGGGTIGGAVAGAFAREGAKVFLAGRTLAALDRVAGEIRAEGGEAETAQVDALDEKAVDTHADAVTEKVGSIDVSFNAIGHGDVHGPPLIEMPFEDFARPITTAMRAQFLTARAAARHMVKQRSGVILAITATTARLTIPQVGGTAVTFDAIESLCRQLARELGPQGVRVVWLLTTGIPEALQDTGDLGPDYGTGNRMTLEEHVTWMQGQTMLNRVTSLADVANAAAFMASDQAGAMTASAVNLTYGAVPTR